MKIKDVRCEVYLREQRPRRIKKDFYNIKRPVGKIPFTILRIITDDGIEGFAFDAQNILNEKTINTIKGEIIGRDPFDREWIWQRLWYMYGRYGAASGRPPGVQALSAVDIALWDITGKALGQPIYKLLGAYRDKIRIYATSWPLPTPEDYAKEALSCKQRGITAYKLHVDPEIAIEACRAVRQAVGDDMKLMLDHGTDDNRERALQVGRELEKLNFYWFEEPLPDYDIEGLIKLREKLDVPICGTEKVPLSMFSMPQYIIHRVLDIIRCDTVMSGGITPCKKIADMCDAFGVKCEIHLANPIGNFANLHVECAVKNCEFYEMYWPEDSYGLKEYPVLDDEGYIHVPQKPGLGAEIDWESLGKPVASY